MLRHLIFIFCFVLFALMLFPSYAQEAKTLDNRAYLIIQNAPYEDLLYLARKLQRTHQVEAEYRHTEPPAELTDDIASDRTKLLEYIKNLMENKAENESK